MPVQAHHFHGVLRAQQSLLFSRETIDALEDALRKPAPPDTKAKLELSFMPKTYETSTTASQMSLDPKPRVLTTNMLWGGETLSVRKGIEMPPAIIFGTLREKYLNQSVRVPPETPKFPNRTSHYLKGRQADSLADLLGAADAIIASNEDKEEGKEMRDRGSRGEVSNVDEEPNVKEASSDYNPLNIDFEADEYPSSTGASIYNQLAGESSDEDSDDRDLQSQQFRSKQESSSKTVNEPVHVPLHARQPYESAASKKFDQSLRLSPGGDSAQFPVGQEVPDQRLWANDGCGAAPVSGRTGILVSRCGTSSQSTQVSKHLGLQRKSKGKQRVCPMRNASRLGQPPCLPIPRPVGFHGAWDSSCGLPVKDVEARLAILRWQCTDHEPKSAFYLYKSRLSLQMERGFKLGPRCLARAGFRRLFGLQPTMVAAS
ncbi:MAG: hypothetical protein Q9188_002149 [Gyalolechia gomerana]